MRNGAPDEVLAGACTWKATVTSWLGGRMLAERVPISSGRVTGDVGDDVIETLSITVPRFAAAASGGDVVDWRPALPDHPLARYGQILDVTIVVSSVITGDVWETRIGRYQIKDWSDDDEGMITVKGESLLARTRDDKLKVLTSPTGSLVTEARRLLPAGMGASFAPQLVDRTAPSAMSWSKDRIKNLQEIANAWPALLRIDPWGQIAFKAPLPTIPTPVLTLRDGRGGTLISAPRSDTRSGAYNEVVASTSGADAADVQGVAAITAGPMNVNAAYGAVTKEWSSPLLENQAQADAAAATILSNSTRPALAIPARIAPDPRIELDDPVEILRGASGHMETVEAVYSDWVEQDRNIFTNPQWVNGDVNALYNSSTEDVADGILTVTAGVNDAPSLFAMLYPVGLAPNSPWSARLQVRRKPGDTAQRGLSIRPTSYLGGSGLPWATTGANATVTLTDDWQDVTFSGWVQGATATSIGVQFLRTGAWPIGQGYQVRLPIMSPTLTCPEYFDGDTQPSGELVRTRWLGPAGSSISVREVRTLLVPEHRIWVVESTEESATIDRQWGWVTAYDLPLTVSDGDMRVDVGLSS